MPIKIIADSACGLSKEVAAEKDIDIIPYLISLGDDKYYEDFYELESADFYNTLITTSCRPKTSMPAIGTFLNRFEKYAAQGFDVVYINMTSAFTGGYNCALAAASQVREAFERINIAVIDSFTCSSMEGFLVEEAVRLAEEGTSFSETVDRIERLKACCGLVFSLDTISLALKGGRLGKMGALIGELLKIKPVIYFKDGHMQLHAKARTRTGAMEQIVNLVVEQTKGFIKEKLNYVLLHTEAYDDALKLGKLLSEKTGCQFKSLPQYICSAIGAHAGPRAIGIGYYMSEPMTKQSE